MRSPKAIGSVPIHRDGRRAPRDAGFYVDNSPRLPLWKLLPPLSFWFLPSAVGVPLLVVALARNGVLGKGRWRRRTGIEPA